MHAATVGKRLRSVVIIDVDAMARGRKNVCKYKCKMLEGVGSECWASVAFRRAGVEGYCHWRTSGRKLKTMQCEVGTLVRC